MRKDGAGGRAGAVGDQLFEPFPHIEPKNALSLGSTQPASATINFDKEFCAFHPLDKKAAKISDDRPVTMD